MASYTVVDNVRISTDYTPFPLYYILIPALLIMVSSMLILKKLFYGICLILSISTLMGCCININSSKANYPLIDHLNNSTVVLVKENADDNTKPMRPFCSGVWISKKYIATARHCVEKTAPVIYFKTFKEFDPHYPSVNKTIVYSATVKVISKSSKDLAILEAIDDVPHHIAEIAESDVPAGTNVHIIGHLIGLEYTYMSGVVSQERYFNMKNIDVVAKLLHVTSNVGPGNSGGGAFNNDGELVGIVSFGLKNIPGLSFFIHKDELLKLLNDNKIEHY